MIDMYIPIFIAKGRTYTLKDSGVGVYLNPDTRVINQLKSDADKIEETIKSAHKPLDKPI